MQLKNQLKLGSSKTYLSLISSLIHLLFKLILSFHYLLHFLHHFNWGFTSSFWLHALPLQLAKLRATNITALVFLYIHDSRFWTDNIRFNYLTMSLTLIHSCIKQISLRRSVWRIWRNIILKIRIVVIPVLIFVVLVDWRPTVD